MASKLYELVYVSSAVRAMSQADLDELLTKARINNHSLTISGMLLYAQGCFLQVLEGEEQHVCQLFEQICADPRHIHPQIIQQGSIEQRHFPDWKMGFRYLDTNKLTRLAGFSDLLRPGSSARNSFKKSPSRSHKLLLSFSECPGIVPTLDTAI